MKYKKIRQSFAGLLAASVIITGGAVPTVSAAEPEGDAQWAQIESDADAPDSLPDSALLGNGNIGITSAGDETSKTYVISDGGFWSDNSRTFGYSNGRSPQLIAGGGITISPVEGKHEYNLAYGAAASASSVKSGWLHPAFFAAPLPITGAVSAAGGCCHPLAARQRAWVPAG